VAMEVRWVLPVQVTDFERISSAAPVSPAASFWRRCSASDCMFESMAERVTTFPRPRPDFPGETTRCFPTKFTASTIPPTESAAAMNIVGGTVRKNAGPAVPGTMGILLVADGLPLDAFSISASVRMTSSSAGLNSASVCGCPLACECQGSKDMPQSVGQAASPHKLPECVSGSYVAGLRQAPKQSASGMHMRVSLGRIRSRRVSPNTHCCLLIGEGFALHARRPEIPAAKRAASGLRINHATVGDTTVVRTKFHDHTRRRLPFGNPAAVPPA